MPHAVYTDAFLDAMGAWQRGWKEQPALRKQLTAALLKAIGETNLPLSATTVDGICYRKRFLYKDNPENGGDHVPIFIGGGYEEGVTSWSTEFEWLKAFKGEIKDDANATIFAHTPVPAEVVLNIKRLWQAEGFADAVDDYKARSGAEADALLNIKDKQSEVILRALLLMEEIEAFCARIGDYDQLFAEAGVVGDQEEEAFVQRLKEINRIPGDSHWLPRDAAQRVVKRTVQKFWEKVETLRTQQAPAQRDDNAA
ncbi:MAG: hypothetical protein C0519_14975 [Hyphomicrobium sp.]|nr:hypothetical protein [Hyphomicrobium sp.]